MWEEVVRSDSYRMKDYLMAHRADPLSILDLGANVGAFCVWAASIGHTVWAIEPVFDNMAALVRNVNECGQGDRVKLMPVALGDHNGHCRMLATGEPTGWVSEPTLERGNVMMSLDTILGLTGASVIKCDVEGAEYAGFMHSSLTGVDYIAMEYHVWTLVGQPSIPGAGTRPAGPKMPTGQPEALIAKLSLTHDTTVIGDDSGGYIYASRKP
jgi:FkbM family methyltransferase